MRRFVILGHTQKATPPIPLNDAAGAGRWDVLARSVASAFLLSNGIRHDVEVFLVLQKATPPRTMWLRSKDLRSLNPDERAILGLLSKALETEPVGDHPMEATPGIAVGRWDLAKVLDRIGKETPLVLLHEHAPLLSSTDQDAGLRDATFVLSDHQEFTNDEMKLLGAKATARYSLGPLSLHTSSCIAIVHNWIDRL